MSIFRDFRAETVSVSMNRLIRLSAIIATSSLITLSGTLNAFGQDIFGSTGVIIKRTLIAAARQPTVQPRRSQKSKPLLQQNGAERLQLVEDAITLGNAQREASPPRITEAERAYQLAAKLNPRDARPTAWLGDLYFEQQRFPEAEATLRRAVALDSSDAISFVRLSYLFTKLGRLDEAEQAAERVQQILPGEYYGYCSMGWSKFRRKNYTEAERAYRRAIELSPKTAGLYSDMGLILLSQKKYPEAMTFLRQALEITPENLSALINYGVLLQRAGRVNEALEQYSRAAALAPQATQPRSNLGMIHYLKGDAAKARESWGSAIERGSAYVIDRAGLLLLDDKLSEALKSLEALTQTSPENADAWLMLGDARRGAGNEDGARAAYTQAAQIAPDYALLKRPARQSQAAAKTLLMQAAAQGQKDQIKELLAKGADPNARGENGGTALMLAAGRGQAEAILFLLKSGADPNLKDAFGQTAIFHAVGNGHLTAAEALLANGANVNSTSLKGITPLKIAQSRNQKELVKILQKAGAKQ